MINPKIRCRHKETTEKQLIIGESRTFNGYIIIRNAALLSICTRCEAEISEYICGGYLYAQRGPET